MSSAASTVWRPRIGPLERWRGGAAALRRCDHVDREVERHPAGEGGLLAFLERVIAGPLEIAKAALERRPARECVAADCLHGRLDGGEDGAAGEGAVGEDGVRRFRPRLRAGGE